MPANVITRKIKADVQGNIPRTALDTSTGNMVISLADPREESVYNLADGSIQTVSELEVFTGLDPIIVTYRSSSIPNTQHDHASLVGGFTGFKIDSHSSYEMVKGSFRACFGGESIRDINGELWTEKQGLVPARQIGSINYQTKVINTTESLYDEMGYRSYSDSTGIPRIEFLTRKVVWTSWFSSFRTSQTNINPGSMNVTATTADGNTTISGTADLNGAITGVNIDGNVDSRTGFSTVYFGEWVADDGAAQAAAWYGLTRTHPTTGEVWQPLPIAPETIAYSAVSTKFVPLDKSIIGVDTTRLPLTGEVPIFRVGDVVVFSEESTFALPNPLVLNQVENFAATDVQYIEVRDQNGNVAPHESFVFDNVAGTVEMTATFDQTPFALPFLALALDEEMRVVSGVNVSGQISVSQPMTKSFDKTKVKVSSALLLGDIKASIPVLFDQNTWTGVFSDSLIGAPATGSYDNVAFPISITNKGSVKQRWVFLLTSSTEFKFIGEEIGEIATGDIGSDFSPINTLTGEPYLTVLAGGWGGGWGANKCLRVNTDSPNTPIWAGRCTQQGSVTLPTDNFEIQLRGDF